MRSVFKLYPVVAALLVSACSSSTPVVTNATVGEHVTREEVPYQRAQERSYFDYFADLRRRLDRLDKRLDVLQEDITDLQTRSGGVSASEDGKSTAAHLAAHQKEAQKAHAMVEREKLAQAEPMSLVPPEKKTSRPASKPAASPTAKKSAVKETIVKTVPAPQAAKTAPVQAAVGGPSRVTGIRISEDGARTRIVFDTSAKATISTDLDNTEKLLVITLPKTGWDAGKAQKFSDLKRVSAYEVMGGTGTDTQVVFTLKNAVTLGNSETLPPDASYGYRTYIDLK